MTGPSNHTAATAESALPASSPSRQPYTPFFPTFHQAAAGTVSIAGQRNLAAVVAPIISSYDTLTAYDSDEYPGVTGYVALTIDDTPCRQTPSHCMVKNVADLLAEHSAKATFMVTAEFVAGKEADMLRLIRDGHELANHGMYEAPCYHMEEEEFEKLFLDSEKIIEDLRKRASAVQVEKPTCCNVFMATTRAFSVSDAKHAAVEAVIRAQQAKATTGVTPASGSDCRKPDEIEPVRWFRSPSGFLSNNMKRVIERHGFTHVLGDCYANDPFITDPKFISDTMLEHVMHGSILIIHMPERGFREYNYDALQFILKGLQAMGLKAVSLSELHARSKTPAKTTQQVSLATPISNFLPDSLRPCAPSAHHSRSSNMIKGVLGAGVAVSTGVTRGIKDLLVKPVEGAREDGAVGFVTGIGRGVTGAVAKPVAGVLEGGSQLVGGVAGTFMGMSRTIGSGVRAVGGSVFGDE